MGSATIDFSSLLEIAINLPLFHLFRNEISFVYVSILAGKTPLIMASIRNFSLLNTLVSGGEEAVVDDDDNVDNSESSASAWEWSVSP